MLARPTPGRAHPRARARHAAIALLLGVACALAAIAAGMPSRQADAATGRHPAVPATTAQPAAVRMPASPTPRPIAPTRPAATTAPAPQPAVDVRALRREVRRLHLRAAALSRAIRLTAVAPLRLSWNAARLRTERGRWARRLAALRQLEATPARTRFARWDAWMCIHRHEGAWDAPGGTYYGGLQMDMAFQRTYGPDLLARKGTADRWTPLEQVLVAERAYAVRGFQPWPNTARMCGVL